MIFEGFFDFHVCSWLHTFAVLLWLLPTLLLSVLLRLFNSFRFVCFHRHGLLEIICYLNVLYCSVLQYTITSDMILNHNMWCYAILWYYMFQLITMYYMLLSHTMLFYSIMLYDIENQYTISYYVILCYYVILYFVVIHCSILD